MRVEQLSGGTLVNGERVIGKKPSTRKGQAVITVTLENPQTLAQRKVTYVVGQNVPGSPRLGTAHLPASDTRRVHDGHQGRRLHADPHETPADRRERREALRLALVG